jgi:hypothetical protein
MAQLARVRKHLTALMETQEEAKIKINMLSERTRNAESDTAKAATAMFQAIKKWVA